MQISSLLFILNKIPHSAVQIECDSSGFILFAGNGNGTMCYGFAVAAVYINIFQNLSMGFLLGEYNFAI